MIEIHLNGKPVTKLQAAREVANLACDYEYHRVDIGEPDENGWVNRGSVTVSGRRHAYGEMQPPEINWSAWGAVSAADARLQAEQIALAVEIAEARGDDRRFESAPRPGPRRRPQASSAGSSQPRTTTRPARSPARSSGRSTRTPSKSSGVTASTRRTPAPARTSQSTRCGPPGPPAAREPGTAGT